MSDLSVNFARREFECQCGCGRADVDPALVTQLERLRAFIGDFPIHILSGVRCPSHNKKVGGKTNSFHLVGKAADIRVPGLLTPKLHDLVVKSGLFKGIGFYPRRGFVHVDIRKNVSRWNG